MVLGRGPGAHGCTDASRAREKGKLTPTERFAKSGEARVQEPVGLIGFVYPVDDDSVRDRSQRG